MASDPLSDRNGWKSVIRPDTCRRKPATWSEMEPLEPRLLLAGDIAITVDALTTNDTTPELTGTISDPDAVIQITVGGASYDAVNNGDGTWTLADDTVAALAEDTYDVLALATNADEGTFGTDTTTEDLIVDLTPPTVTVDNLTTDDTTPELTGTVNEDDATIVVNIDGVDYDAVNNGDGTWTLPDNTTAPLPNGTYDVAVTATDPAGNDGTDATTDELTVNTNVPVITIDELATSDTTPELTGTITDPAATIQIMVAGNIYDAVNNGDGTWTLADDTIAELEEGIYDVVAVATNAANGTSDYDDTFNELDIDLTDPVVTVNVLITADTTPQLTGTVSEPDATVWVNVDGNDYEATNNGNGTWTLDDDTIAPELANGSYDVAATATDQAGNVGTDETVNELVIKILPEVTVDELDTNDTTPQLTGTIDDPAATIVVTVDENDYDAVNNGDGTWTLADDTIAALEEGTYDVVATATNPFGNYASDDTTNELTVDTTAPVVGIDDAFTTSDTTPQLTGTIDDATATVTVTVNGNDYEATNNGDGTWTLANDTIDPPLDEGSYDITATAADDAGNEDVETLQDGVTITLTPTVTVDELTTNDTTPQLTGTVDTIDAVVTVTVNGVDYDAINYGDGTWALPDNTVAELDEGTYDVTVTATSGVHVGTDDTTDELVIDTTEPTVAVDQLITTYRSPQLTGTVNDNDAVVEVLVNGTIYDAVNNGDGTWTLAQGEIAPLGTTTYDVQVRATDQAGNEGFDETVDELIVMAETTLNFSPALRKVFYTDPDGSKVIVYLFGDGSVTLSFASNSMITVGGQTAWKVLDADAGVLLTSADVTSDSKGLIIRASRGADGGTTVGQITGNFILTKLNARNVDLINNGINMNGIIHSIMLRNVQANITMVGVAPRGVLFRVFQAVEDANIRITGSDVRNFTTGRMTNSSLYVGVAGTPDENGDGTYDLPELINILDDHEIKVFRITGFRGAVGDLFTNSNIAADAIGTAQLRDATLDNTPDEGDAVPFGLATNNIRRLTLRQGQTNYTWPNNWLADPQDLEIRLV
ncbi:MAG: Ig-like domain-containing protein [Planctomycetota bacterium]|nr:Ig-like domain-containing protein [Planctomycetota bacterium]